MFDYLYTYQEDHEPNPYSVLQRGLNESFVKFYESGGYDWTHVTIKKLESKKRGEEKYMFTILHSDEFKNND
jgi:hypothetical protein